MTRIPGLAVLVALSCGAAPETAFAQTAQPGLPAPATLAERAAKRFPQPVRAGDLIGRSLLQPIEAQPILGHIQSLTRRPGGTIDLIIRQGNTLGLGGHSVAVPIEAVALLGEHVALIDYTPGQLAALPQALPGEPLPPDTTIRVGLVKPFH